MQGGTHAQVRRWVARGCLAAFVLLMVASMWAYPGGDQFDLQHDGHRFFHNFICDLFESEALNGKPNGLGAALAGLAVLVMFLGVLLPLWWYPFGENGGPRGLVIFARSAGALSTACMLLMCVEVAMRLPIEHALLALTTAGAGLVATIAVVVGGLLQPQRSWLDRGLGLAVVISAAANIIYFVSVEFGDAKLTPVLPGTQKLIAVVLIAWLSVRTRASGAQPA